MKQIAMVAILGLALVLATATVSMVPVQHVSAQECTIGHCGPGNGCVSSVCLFGGGGGQILGPHGVTGPVGQIGPVGPIGPAEL